MFTVSLVISPNCQLAKHMYFFRTVNAGSSQVYFFLNKHISVEYLNAQVGKRYLDFPFLLNKHAKISYQLSSGDTLPALLTEVLGKLIHPFG